MFPPWEMFLALGLLLLTTSLPSGLSQLLYNGPRLTAFSKPDFRTTFLIRSNNGSGSFREVYTGQNQRPFHVRVYAKVLSGVNNGFCFEGVGAAQVTARKRKNAIHSYGGLVYAYNSNYVRIWAPSLLRNSSNGRVIFVCQGWGGEKYSQRAQEALVVVEVWNIGPVPTFQTNILVDIRHADRVFFEVDHGLAEIPERVLVRVTPLNEESRKPSPNYGFWFNGISSSQNVEKKGYGGVIFAYNQKKIQIWLPNSDTKNTGCVYVKNGWGGERLVESAPRCMVYIFAWVMKLPVPSFTTDWKSLSSQGRQQESFLEIKHGMNMLPGLVIVQGRSNHKGLIFEATGVVMSTDSNLKGYGGILFAYDENSIRIWLPQRHNGTKDGYSIYVNGGWGNGHGLVKSHIVKVRVLVYTLNCDSTQETVTEKGICQNFKYNSYHWQTGPWFKCSSICNKGERRRAITGCEVSTSETVLNCGFDKDMCGWRPDPPSSWKRINGQRHPGVDLHATWNQTNESYYIFATSNNSKYPVVLASPKFPPQKSCSLSFNYKMFGEPPPIFSVYLSLNGRSPEQADWSMQDDQGLLFWRQGYLQLTNIRQLTQVFFKFTLNPKPENDRSPSSGNISLDAVKLECESVKKRSVDAKVCKKRKVHSAGCIHLASKPTNTGPAFALTNANNQNYVIARGQPGQLIASYEFMVYVAGAYSIWLHSFGTSINDNGVSFQIDNIEIRSWHTTYIDKANRPLWTQYMYDTFPLNVGLHTVYLSQLEANFRFSYIVLTPKRLLTWAPLGMQSRYIPDSHVDAYPPSSVPAPKYGRLNGVDAWCSSDHNAGFVRLEITLPELALVSRIAVQGGQQIKKRTNSYWVTEFKLKVSVDGIHFSWYRVSFGKKPFPGNIDASGIVEHELPFAVLAKRIQIYPYTWRNWICMRVELYGLYMTSKMCSVAGHESPTSKLCDGDRNCSKNAECRPLTKDSIIKTGAADPLGGLEACHCHTGYHGDSCQHFGCDPNPCSNGGTCHPRASNFTCICPTGCYGALCQHACPVGMYGKDCAHRCVCGDHGSCDGATGHCSCEPGYYGGACDKVCPSGYYGNDCKQRCMCENNGDCDHVTGNCACAAGWMGPFCSKPCNINRWGIHCRQQCQCSKSALSCNRLTGDCICKSGKTGKRCDQTCPLGKYGLLCTGICQCSNYGTCDSVDGNCTCHVPGWTGVKCHRPCPRGFYGIDCKKGCTCSEMAECDASSGDCKCARGVSGSRCTIPCSGNKWGPGCENTCQCANNALCDSVTGACHCPAGWYGTLCSNNCTDGKWGSTCNKTCDCQNNATCHSLTAVCQCQPGWSGSKCEKPCQPGFSGPRCQSKCVCTHGNDCEPTTGGCLCPPGWLGYTCAEACPFGYYGDGCSKTCSCANGATCDHVSGACTCAAGWNGSSCSRQCPSGFYGNECSRQCPCSRNSKGCDHVTGRCLCSDGYVGARCSQPCNPGYFGKRCEQKCECQNGGECRSTDGKCVCLAGYDGDYCEHGCPVMRYGINCSQTCSACIHSQVSTCSPVTGKCICSAGYYGYHCENRCPEGKYGLTCALKCDCQNGAHCDHVNGSCACVAGFTGDKCDRPCPQGSFGNKCLGTCLCQNAGLCDKVTGECSCLAGYQGTQCVELCAERRWGIECQNKCNCAWNHTMRCRGDTGACECRAGYRGTTCEKFCDDGTYGQDCQHPCPKCSRHVTGTCYKIDGRCPCSPGYRGRMCDNDCPLNNYGNNCGRRCKCQLHEVCHNVDGKCFPISSGRFEIIIVENYIDMDDIRQKEIKLHMANLMSLNYPEYLQTLHRLSRRETPSHSPPRSQNTTVTTSASSAYITPSTDDPTPTSRHDFVARILDLSPGLCADGRRKAVIIAMVMFDGADMLNGSIVKNVIESMDVDALSEIIGSIYYSGALYSESADTPSPYIQWVTGVAGGLLLLVVVVIVFMMYRRRRRHLKTLKKQRKKEKEAETEMELKTRSFRHNGYRLAFDNPYYDVLAAMALDDDIEEDYINPLCDLESLMSHQGSDATVSSATECSIQKGESLQSVSFC